MEYQVTPEQGKELIEKLKSVGLDSSMLEELTYLQSGWKYFSSENLDKTDEVGCAFDKMVKRMEYSDVAISYDLLNLFPHAYRRFHVWDNYWDCEKKRTMYYTCKIVFRPKSPNLTKVFEKEGYRKHFLTRFEDASNLGVNVFLNEDGYKNLQNCLYPINHDWVEESLKEMRELPTYTDEQLVELFNGIINEKETLITAVKPIPSSKKKGIFATLFGG